jgi:hypothetical protein
MYTDVSVLLLLIHTNLELIIGYRSLSYIHPKYKLKGERNILCLSARSCGGYFELRKKQKCAENHIPEDVHKCYSSLNIIVVIKTKRMK